jgi:hypothetical protein
VFLFPIFTTFFGIPYREKEWKPLNQIEVKLIKHRDNPSREL